VSFEVAARRAPSTSIVLQPSHCPEATRSAIPESAESGIRAENALAEYRSISLKSHGDPRDYLPRSFRSIIHAGLSRVKMNFTLTVPEGSTNHRNPKLLCTPPEWYDFIIFFFTNYVAHASTVVPEPGQSPLRAGVYILLALTLPGSAVFRAVTAIARHVATETKNPLRRAARAGALCMVLRRPTIVRRTRTAMRDTQNELGSGDTASDTTQIVEVSYSGEEALGHGLNDGPHATEEGTKESPTPARAPSEAHNDPRE
jgi:hypothetical protein